MNLSFHAAIHDTEIKCEIGSDTALSAPIFCFSLMAKARVVSGGILIKTVAGYAEVALPDIPAGGVVKLTLAHDHAGFRPTNRAWLPLGGYLRIGTQTLSLPEMPAGVNFDRPAPRAAAPFDGLKLIPQPTRWTAAKGSLATESFASDHPAFRNVDALSHRLGLPPFLSAQGRPVTISTDLTLDPEAYTLTIDPSGIASCAADLAGQFNAAITLLNLRELYSGQLPCGTISDAPRFAYRGQHLDCARHFYQPKTLHRLLDLMALVKLNHFHWHFADDEAFRLQVDSTPDLWRKTAFRGENCAVPGVFGGGIRSGGSYSRSDVQTLISAAQSLNIAVLPEIEVPAHSFAINRAVPGLRDPADNGPEISIQGYAENILNPAIDATWDFLTPLALEVAALFPIGILHLGCDELPPDAWSSSPAVHALKQREGLASRDDVQGWMMARLAGQITQAGVRPAAWEEAAKGVNGGIGHNALLFSWTGQGPGVEAARAGYDVVMCPAQHAYFDMAHTNDPDDWGASWAAFIGLEDTVNWSPVPAGAEDIAHKVVGVESTFWSEFTTEDRQIEPLLAPRILGLANKAWDRNDSVDGPKLRSLAAAYGPLFDRIGWLRHKGA